MVIASLLASPWSIWGIAGLATAGVIARPFSWPEFVWAGGGAVLLLALGLLSPAEGLAGVAKGTDVYLFLVGMMLLSELARQEGLFEWLAARAAGLAKGSATRLFTLVFAVGIVVTVFLSNDATAVVLTPAVAAVVKTAKVKRPLPYLLICAFIANAASFVLPISNPANLVIYGSHMPPLLQWLPRYALPSALSIVATFIVLRWTQRKHLRQPVSADIEVPHLPPGGTLAAIGIVATAIVLLAASGFDIQLGLPTFLAGAATTLLVLTRSKCGPIDLLKGISWGVVPLVAGLFVLVEALAKTGVTQALAELLQSLVQQSAALTAWGTGVVARGGLQPGQQPARRPGRRARGRVGARARRCSQRRADRRRSRAEPVRYRVARHDPVADRAAPRGPERRPGHSSSWARWYAAGLVARHRRRLRLRLKHRRRLHLQNVGAALPAHYDRRRPAGPGIFGWPGMFAMAAQHTEGSHWPRPTARRSRLSADC